MAPIPYNTNKKKGYNLDPLFQKEYYVRRKASSFLMPLTYWQNMLDPKQELLSEFADISYKKPDERPKEYKGYKYDAELSNRDTAVYYPIDTSKEFKPAIVSYRGTDISQFNKRAIQDIGQDLLIASNIAGITKNINPRYIEAKKTFDKTTEKYGRTEITGHSLGSRVGYETALSLDTRGKKLLDKATLFSLPFGLGAITTNPSTYLLPEGPFKPTSLASERISQQTPYREGKDKTKIFEKIESVVGQYDPIGAYYTVGRIPNTKYIQEKFNILAPFNPINYGELHKLTSITNKDLKEKDKIKDEL